MEVKIREDYKVLVPSLSESEYEQLKESIRTNGLYTPIIVNPDGEILDGHNRFKICQELGIAPKIEVKAFDTPEQEGIFVIEANLKRRQLNEPQRIKLVHEKLEPLEKELARKRQLAGLNKGPLASSISNEINGTEEAQQEENNGSTIDKMAEASDTSSTTYYRTTTVLDKGTEEVKEQMLSGEISQSKAYDITTKQESKRKPRTERKDRGLKDYLLLPSSQFAAIVQAVEDAKSKGESSIKLYHNKHEVKSIGAITLEP